MINAFTLQGGRLIQVHADITSTADLTDILWIDMVEPSDEEREWVQKMFRTELPEDEELKDIEESARCYEDETGLHLNSFFLYDWESNAVNVTVSFTLHEGRLLTMHEMDLPVFRLFRRRARVRVGYVEDALDIVLGLYELAVEHDADVLENIYAVLEEVSREVLIRQEEMSDVRMEEVLMQIAVEEDINGKTRLDLMDTRRALSFVLRRRYLSMDQRNDLKDILRDIESLNGHTAFLFEKINFLMDAMMGLINLAQNKTIKIFSIAAVVFLPPTLVASIYGMNFQFMPELGWHFGYPFALILMIVSGLAPYYYFKRKGWLN